MGEMGIVNGTIGGEGKNITLSYAIIKDSTLQNITIQNGTSINITTLNATNIAGNGSQIWNLNATNITTGVLQNSSIPLSAANISAHNTFTGNVNVLGNVGIGTTSPNANLTIKHTVNGAVFQITDNDDEQKLIIYDYAADGPYMRFYGATGLTIKTQIAGGYDTMDTFFNSGGNVGIGNTTPGYDLTIGTNPWSGMNAGDAIFTTSSNAPPVFNGSGLYSLNMSNQTAAVRILINVTQNYTIGVANTTSTLFTCHANSGTLNVSLPTGVAGTEFTIKKKDATTNTCSVFSGQNIDGARYANISTQYESIDVIYTSDEWSII